MSYILDVQNLTKQFPKSDFCLDNISFSLPYGAIMGFVWENGAGKTTTISCILNTLFKDSGIVKLFEKEISEDDMGINEDIGVVFDANNFSGSLTANQVSKIMQGVYSKWDNAIFDRYLNAFKLPVHQTTSS